MLGEERRGNKEIDFGAGTKAKISRKDAKHVGINGGKGLVYSSCIPGFSELGSCTNMETHIRVLLELSEFNASTINTFIKIHLFVVRSYN